MVVGTLEGTLLAYRPTNPKPFASVSRLGTITVTIIGDLMRRHVNCVFCITHDGTAYVWALRRALDSVSRRRRRRHHHRNHRHKRRSRDADDDLASASAPISIPTALPAAQSTTTQSDERREKPAADSTAAAANRSNESDDADASASDAATPPPTFGGGDGATVEAQEHDYDLVLLHRQAMPPNTKYVLIHDFDCDGYPEILLGLTDRTVRLYKWQHNERTSGFVGLYKWEFAAQIGSISLLDVDVDDADRSDDRQCARILVSQAGGRYAHIDVITTPAAASSSRSAATSRQLHHKVNSNDDDESSDSNSSPLTTPPSSPKNGAQSEVRQSARCVDFGTPHLHELASARSPKRKEYTWIVGNVAAKVDGRSKRVLALSTSHGNIQLVDDDRILLDFQVERKLHFIQKYDMSGEGCADEVFVFADRADVQMGGLVYVIDSEQRVAKLWLPETPKVIYAGEIGIAPTRTSATSDATTPRSRQSSLQHGRSARRRSLNTFSFAALTTTGRLMLFYDIPRPNFNAHSMLTHLPRIVGLSADELAGVSDARKRRMLRRVLYRATDASSSEDSDEEHP